MEITLKIKGEYKTFTQEFVPLKLYRKALEIYNEQTEGNSDAEKNFDKQLALIVDIFDKQFTKDQLENGLNVVNHKEVMYDLISVGVLGFLTREEIEKKQKEEADVVGKLLKELAEKESPSNSKSNE